ncbi:MAG: hypothetical protein K8Q97_03010 [Candidatus Andersenbacteria bacterium]|nr:hypothetical protein [Candidatus Andersenbacteria bacterium]
MIKHIWSVLCQKSVIDSDTNNITLFDILERIDIEIKIENPQLPEPERINIPINFEIVSFFENTDPLKNTSGDNIIEFCDSKGQVLNSFKQEVKMPKGMKRLRARFKINGLAVNKVSSDYVFRIKLKSHDMEKYKTLTEIPFETSIKIHN